MSDANSATMDELDLAARRYEFHLVPNVYGGYYVRVPAFPEVVSGGGTPAEAAANAVEAIALALDWYHSRGQEPPAPDVRLEQAA